MFEILENIKKFYLPELKEKSHWFIFTDDIFDNLLFLAQRCHGSKGTIETQAGYGSTGL